MKRRFLVTAFILCCSVCAPLWSAQDTLTGPKIEWTAMAALEEGQFVKSEYIGGPMSFRPWLTDEYVRLGIQATCNRHFKISIIPQIELWNDTWDWTGASITYAAQNPLVQHATVTLADAEAVANFGNKEAVALNISAGVIPYKYDAEAKNLGEYLFRTGEHPTYIFNSFDQAYSTLTGLRINAEIFHNLSADVFLTTETQVQPVNDGSLSFLLGYKLPRFLDAGAGVVFDRLFPAVPLLNKPVSVKSGTYYNSSGQLDTFSFSGTKVMARLAFDPKGFLPSNVARVFGKEDGKIYGEAAILGVTDINAVTKVNGTFIPDTAKNYYSNIRQRIPVMFGFNFPTFSPLLQNLCGFSLLDYLSAEFEWFGDPYAPGMYTEEGFQYFLPLPNGKDPAIAHWKYSFNCRKTLWGHISLSAQIARDHTRHDIYSNWYGDADEIFRTKDQWGWWLKLQYNL